MKYVPKPIDTSHIQLSGEISELTEILAKNTHELWAEQRIKDGWVYGPERNDTKKEHPGLVEYEELSESEKEYDRITAMNTIKTIIALGFTLKK
ncbi:Ryanodine receptor Ryr [Priestia megaterium]|uniref:RyR domain-containing protein n=1 Tax=Priestia megaterium TaxID=1404 RepID=UPI001C228DA1|nr:RyR domain-containing protein [Priestia megaterium]MBU8687455.1 Ryanodine receptor Ryr [Priestia megaterium]